MLKPWIVTDSQQTAFDHYHLEFLLGMLITSNPSKDKTVLPREEWFAGRDWFLDEIANLVKHLHRDKTKIEKYDIINEMIKRLAQNEEI